MIRFTILEFAEKAGHAEALDVWDMASAIYEEARGAKECRLVLSPEAAQAMGLPESRSESLPGLWEYVIEYDMSREELAELCGVSE